MEASNWFDTAELYGSGVSEKSLSTASKAAGIKGEEVIIATKWWPLFRTARNIPKTIGERLRFLEGYSIGLYQVHQPYSFSSPEAEMDAMAGLVKAGLIRSVGISNFNADAEDGRIVNWKSMVCRWPPTRWSHAQLIGGGGVCHESTCHLRRTGELASFSFRLNANNAQVMLGEKDTYEARSRQSFFNDMKNRNK